MITRIILLLIFITFTSSSPIHIDDISIHTYYSFVAYCDWSQINYLLPNYDAVCSYSANDKTDNFGFVLISHINNQIIVTLRGTVVTSTTNLIEDADILPRVQAWKNYRHVPDNVWVHPGFWSSWNLLKKGIFEGIAQTRKQFNSTKITFTGHSLGGAMATIAAMDYWVTTGHVPRVITFGSPRVGNYYFAHYFEQIFGMNSYRFVNHNDFIPHLPLEDMGYYHTSVENWFQNGTKSFRSCNFLGEDPACSDQESFWVWDLGDHSLYPSLFGLTPDLKACNGSSMNPQAIAKLEEYRKPDRLKGYTSPETHPI
jgi:hypothetical protein